MRCDVGVGKHSLQSLVSPGQTLTPGVQTVEVVTWQVLLLSHPVLSYYRLMSHDRGRDPSETLSKTIY